MNKPAVCIATIRPEQFKVWLEAWQDEFRQENVEVFAMVDAETSEEFTSMSSINGHIFNHSDVVKKLGDKAWIIPKRTSACKSFAIYKAWRAGCDPIMVLDDDCLPLEWRQGWVLDHASNLSSHLFAHVFMTMHNAEVYKMPRPRGVPHIDPYPVGLSHGTWMTNPDIDSITQLSRPGPYKPPVSGNPKDGCVPVGSLFPMSGMNLAFRSEIAPLMYFGLQGPDWGVDRFDDIWCGFLAKKVLDHCGYAVWSGTPYVRHVKASDPFTNIVKEAPGYKMNVELYEWAINLQPPLNSKNGIADTLSELASYLKAANRYEDGGREYWYKYGEAIHEWLELFEPEEAFGI